MKKRIVLRKAVALLIIMSVMTGAFSGLSVTSSAQSKSELEDKIDDIDAQTAEIQKNIDSLAANAEKKEEYQAELNKKIDVNQEKIDLLQEKIGGINTEISASNEKISAKEQEIAETTQQFKERLRTMYTSSNESMLSIIFGSSSFYEMVMSIDLVKRITQHDRSIVEKLNEQKRQIEEEKAVLEQNKAELDGSKAEVSAVMKELSDDYAKTDEAIKELEAEQAMYEGNLEELLAERAAAQKEIDDIIAEEMRKAEEARKKAEQAAANGTSGGSSDYKGPIKYVGGTYMWPLPGHYVITSYYGWRTLYGQSDFHTGIDIADGAVNGLPISAANDGVVTVAGWLRSYGYCVLIDHGGGSFTRYAHCSSLAVSAGQTVSKGDTIGYVGSTGNSTGPHLHFEIYENGQRVNPLNYF